MTQQQQDELWQYFNRFQKSREKTYTPKINKALKAQVKQYIDSKSIDAITSGGLYDTLKPLYLDAGINYGAKVISYLKQQKARRPIGFNRLMIELINQYFQIDLLNTVETITFNTKELIKNVLIESYAIGSSFNEIVAKITSPSFTAIRARLIARTETVIASNTGANLAVKTTGVRHNKVWISATDNRTRRTPRDKFDHLHMKGITIPDTDLFNVSGELMMYPGDTKHGATAGNICNCRCTHGYIGIRDKNGRLIKA
jgi:hypothetical protein